MTSRTLVHSVVVYGSLALLACGVPKKYLADRDHLNATLEAFERASAEVSQLGGGAAGPARMTSSLRGALETSLSEGLASADSVGDPFLAWLHPELPRQFRDNLVGGERLLLEAVRAEDSARLARAEQRLMDWDRYWQANGMEILQKANP